MDKPVPDGSIEFRIFEGESTHLQFKFSDIKHWTIKDGCLFIETYTTRLIYPLTNIKDAIVVTKNSKDYLQKIAEYQVINGAADRNVNLIDYNLRDE